MSSSASALLRKHWLDTLLSLVPVSLALEAYGGDPLWVFGAAGLAIVPLAGWMGRATEHLASRLGEGIGGLLNATFGNAAELIIALFALREGLHEVVKASITGSIIGNILLVLGLSMVAGGMRYTVQVFNRSAASMGASLLLLSAIGLVVPTVFHALGPGAADERGLSLEIALVLFVTYLLSLVFSLRTHRHLYVGEEPADEDPDAWSRRRSFVVLMITSGLIAVMAELLVGSVEHAATALGLTEVFVGVILVAIVGNAAEHSTAVLVAMRGKMDLAVHIAIGSSLQIALFVAPVLLFVSYLFGTPMDLVFTPFEVFSVVLAVLAVNHIASDGECNWMEGVQLLAVYLILGLAFYFLPATP
ncbi:MAG: calcium/proton exchanger [Gammaproteobacteria bacterium]